MDILSYNGRSENAKSLVTGFFQQIERKEEAWHRFFLEGKDPDVDVISPQILESWKRCRKWGLDPYHVRSETISLEELKILEKKNEFLIEAAKPVFDTFVESMGADVITLDLYDRELTFIHTFGNRSVFDSRRYSVPGIRRPERTSGVTAMSLAAETGQPAQLVGPEHFDASLHDKVCTSIPLFDDRHELLGVINYVEKLDNPNPLRTLQMMQSLGQGITYSLRLLEKTREAEAVSRMNRAIIEEIGDGIIATDGNGIIRLANYRARTLLGYVTRDLIGLSAEGLFGEDNPLSRVQQSGKEWRDREMILTCDGMDRRFFGSVKPIGGMQNEITGVIATFNDIRSTQKALKNIAGWEAPMTFRDIIGNSPELQATIRLAREAAGLSSNVLIQGESGTGKEIFAHAIHNAGPFSGGPFVAINCSAVPNSLMESELFGYEGGTFTGARKNGMPGKFELAQNGTIFLDEINSMPPDMQSKLLRVLQEKAVMRLGGTSRVDLNIKVIAAANVDLAEAVKNGLFRLDLFYRLNVLTLRIPPLRERIEDIPLLSRHFLQRFRDESGFVPELGEDACRLLSGYSWPGNVRELENVLERAMIQLRLTGGRVITEEVLLAFPEFGRNPRREVPGQAEDKAAGGSVHDYRRRQILDALERNGWNISRTAKDLGIVRNTLYRRMKEFGIELH